MLRTALMMVAALALVAGCEKAGEAPTTGEKTAAATPAKAETPAPEKAAPAPAKPAAAPEKAPAALTYRVKITPGDAEAGKQATSVVEVTPMPGYKMNKDFPSRLKIDPAAGATIVKTEFGKDDCELTDEALRFEVPFTAAAAGKLDLAGMADFSVCNENACKLIRDEKLAWQVAVR